VVTQSVDGVERRLELSPLEFKLLVHFCENRDRVMSREQLLQAVWPGENDVSDRVIDHHVSNLRKKIGASAIRIKTIVGEGYSFELSPKDSEE
jgi:DNA-binding response OmpR family regulator